MTVCFCLDDSDNPSGLVSHLPRRLLAGQAQRRQRKRAATNREALEADSSDEEEEPPIDPGKFTKKNPGLLGSRIPPFQQVDKSPEDQELLKGLSTALDFYKLFQPDEFVDQVRKKSCSTGTVNFLTVV